MTVRVSAWQWYGEWAWASTALHAAGAVLTSAAFAGVCALFAAKIAAKQVIQTRGGDEAHRRLERLWERFGWTIANADSLGAEGAVRTLILLLDTARAQGDDELVQIIRARLMQLRLELVRTSNGITEGGVDQ